MCKVMATLLKKNLHFSFGIILALMLLDQASKIWILHSFSADPAVRTLLPIFDLRLAFNSGVSFSFLHNAPAALLIAGASAVVLVLLWFLKDAETALARLAFALIIGGALGNIIDRVRFGFVVDFLHFHWQHWHFPTFNVADCGITIGAILLFIDAFMIFKEKNTHA